MGHSSWRVEMPRRGRTRTTTGAAKKRKSERASDTLPAVAQTVDEPGPRADDPAPASKDAGVASAEAGGSTRLHHQYFAIGQKHIPKWRGGTFEQLLSLRNDLNNPTGSIVREAA
mmetsp:Transcript_47097/g.107450  ORF Transcript_47097/g.107450 Transcript_47097/m.107450 type:complete len:115 (+) Transcript_47097:30-374(+)